MNKILLITNIISPTRTTFYNDLSDYLVSQWWELLIIFLSASESNRERDLKTEIEWSRFLFKVLKSKQLEVKWIWNYSFYMHYNTWINKILDEENPDIIMHDWWASLSARQSQKRCKKHNKKYILWNESTIYEPSWRRTITKPIVKSLVRNSDWYISFWTRAKKYLEILWANPIRICEYYNPVDNGFFMNESNGLKDKRGELKEKYWIKTKYCVLFVWQMLKLKWIYEIVEWFNLFSKNHDDWSLLMVWDWEERKNIEQLIQKLWVKNVIMPWYVQKEKISELYSIADVFTLPSYSEVWWLVINEALCFWLPIITSNEVWASEDLVIEWKTWYVMKNHSPEEWCKWLNYIIDNNLIDNQSLEHILKFNNDKFIPNIKMFLD